MDYSPTEIEREAIKIVKNEVNDWQEGHVYLTDKILFKTRNIIKRSRKNYFNTFDDDRDPATDRKKIFLPITRDMVETTVKNIDLDVKDILTKAKNSSSYGIAALVTYILRDRLHSMRFGEILNRILRKTAVEGIAVMKTMKTGDSEKPYKFQLTENLNLFYDPSVNYLSETPVTERHWISISDTKKYNWKHLEFLAGKTSIERVEDLQAIKTQIPYIDLWERHGLIPKYLLSGKSSDKDLFYEGKGEYVLGTIVISDLKGKPVVHLIAQNKTDKSPYTEFRTKTYDGRMLGMGIGEDLDQIQSYGNELFNIQINSARTKLLGLWKYRKGAGIKPQEISKLYNNMGIGVTRMDDLEELRTEDIKPSNPRMIEDAYRWAQRMTGAWELQRGEQLPRVQPATTAVLQEQGARSGFSLQQEELGFSISKFLETAFLPAILSSLKDGEEIGIIEQPRLMDEVVKDLESYRGASVGKFKKTKFFKIDNKKMFDPDKVVDFVQIHITGEDFDKNIMVQQLDSLLKNYGQIPGFNLDPTAIGKEIIDIMGLGGERFVRSEPAPQMTQQTMKAPSPQGAVEAIAQAGTFEGTGRGAGLTR